MISATVFETRRIFALGLLRFGLPAHHGLVSVCVLLLLLPSAGAQSDNNGRSDLYQQQRFSASMAIIIVVLIAALFFMGFFSIYIRHCSEVRNGGNTVRPGAGGGLGRSRRAARGVDQAVIDTFPTFEYSAVKGLKIGKGALECAVCLNEFEDDETLRLLPKCDHVFHPECIDAWLASHVTCPVCRANLSEASDPEAAVEAVESAGESDQEIEVDDRRPEIGDARDLSIRVAESENDPQQPPDVINPIQLLNQNRPPRSRSTRPRKFPRSHSTGHSLIQPGENCERFTLKLPDDVRKEIMKRALNRTTSLVVLPREGSSRRGYRTGEGSSRGKYFRRFDRLDRSGKFDRLDRSAKSDRWTFTITPPFFSRASSLKSPKVAADGEATTSTTPRKPTLTPKTSFGAKHDPAGTSPAGSPRPPV